MVRMGVKFCNKPRCYQGIEGRMPDEAYYGSGGKLPKEGAA